MWDDILIISRTRYLISYYLMTKDLTETAQNFEMQ